MNATLNTELMIENATLVLDNLLDIYRKAQKNFDESVGTISEAHALEFGNAVFAKYEATKQAYAAIGLIGLGIHNNKAGN